MTGAWPPAGVAAICRGEPQLQRGVLRTAPAWLLAKLALDRSLRGDKDRQRGAQLLREALEKIVASVDLGGGRENPRPPRLWSQKADR